MNKVDYTETTDFSKMSEIDRMHYMYSKGKAKSAFIYSRLAFSIKLAMKVKI